jgi:hypothetical protein
MAGQSSLRAIRCIPASGGTTDTFVQASILDLYDPTRSKRFVQKGKASTREEFEKFLGEFGKTI